MESRRKPGCQSDGDYRPAAFSPRSTMQVDVAFAIILLSSSVIAHSI